MSILKEKKLTMAEVEKCDPIFQPLLASAILDDTLNDITKHKKDFDDAQKARINLALKILSSDMNLPAYPSKTVEALLKQMEKQKKKIDKKAAK